MNTEELRVYIRTVSDLKGAQQTQQGLRGLAREAAAIGAAVGFALPNIQQAVQSVIGAFAEAIDVQRRHERVVRATGMAYGEQADSFTRFATALEAQTGFASDAILEAALSARTLSQNYGLSIQQTQKLITVSADLARVRGIGIAEAFERVQSAIRGEAEASEYLGLTLNDTFLRNQAMNGSLRDTYEKMTDVQKAQIRFTELLRQSAQFSGLAAKGTNDLDAAFIKAEKSARDFQRTLGEFAKPGVITGLAGIADLMNDINIKMREADALAKGLERTNLFDFLEGPAPARQATRKNIEELNQLGVGLLKLSQAEAAATGTRTAREYVARGMASATERAASARQEERRIKTLRQIALEDQVEAAIRDATAAMDHQTELQRRTVDLAAEEAQIRLGMLPAQQRMTELQRQMTEQQIRARQAALPATEALEDLRYLQQRAQLIGQNRNVSVEQRIAARRELRGIGRALPGAELAALEAGRGVTLAGRAAERLGMEQQLFEIANQRQLEQITQAQTTNQLLSQIAAQRVQAIELTINLGTEEFQTEVFKQLVEAEKQAQGPTVVKLSGVRR